MTTIADSTKFQESYTPHVREHIQVKPSIELIPDEYERCNNDKVFIKMIHTENDKAAINLLEKFDALGFHILPSTVLRESYDDENAYIYIKSMVEMKEEINKRQCDGIIVIFSKAFLNYPTMREIWSQFTSLNCPKLLNKPRVIIFQIPELDVVKTDASGESRRKMNRYDSPAEADMLIVQDMYNARGTNQDLMESLLRNIETYGKQEDFVSLMTICTNFDSTSMLSTMTRKFYLMHNEHKGHHHSIMENHQYIKKHLEKIKQHVSTQKPVKASSSKPSTVKKNSTIKSDSRKDTKTAEKKKKLEEKPRWKY